MNARVAVACLALLVVAPSTAVSPGCAIFQRDADPNSVYDEWNEIYIAVARNLIAAYDNGDISQDDWDAVYAPAIAEADRLLDTMYASAGFGDIDGVSLAADALRSVMTILEGGVAE